MHRALPTDNKVTLESDVGYFQMENQIYQDKIVQIRWLFKATNSYRNKSAGSHKARRSCLRESRVCWLCIPHQLVVFLFVPDQFAAFVCLLILRTVSCCSLTPRNTQRVHRYEIRTCWARSAKKKALKRLTYMIEFYTHRFQHGDVLQTGWFLFLLEYIWSAVQLAASRDLHAECASHS